MYSFLSCILCGVSHYGLVIRLQYIKGGKTPKLCLFQMFLCVQHSTLKAKSIQDKNLHICYQTVVDFKLEKRGTLTNAFQRGGKKSQLKFTLRANSYNHYDFVASRQLGSNSYIKISLLSLCLLLVLFCILLPASPNEEALRKELDEETDGDKTMLGRLCRQK